MSLTRIRIPAPFLHHPSPPHHQTSKINATITTTSASSSVIDARDRVVVVGGGIAGLSTALALNQVKIPSVVLERGAHLRMEGTAIGILANGWKALEALTVAEELRSSNPLCVKVEWRNAEGRILKTFSLEDAECENEMRGVVRGKLLSSLANALPPDSIFFDHNLTSIDLSSPNQTVLKFSNGVEMKCRVVVGADGNRSRIATALGLPLPEFSGYSAIRGISHFDKVDLQRQTIMYYLATGMRFGMYQVEEDKIYWFIAFNTDSDYSIKDEATIMQKAKDLSKTFDFRVQQCLDQSIPDCLSFSKIGDRVANPFKALGKDLVTLCGDAFHPMTPNLGQGGAVALEDSVVLAQNIASVGGLAAGNEPIAGALRDYERQRMKRVIPLTLRSRAIGTILQTPFDPVQLGAEFMISQVLDPGNVFLSTAQYDCGSLAT